MVDANCLSVFCYRQHDGDAVPYAFDPIELKGTGLRSVPFRSGKIDSSFTPRQNRSGYCCRAVRFSRCGGSDRQNARVPSRPGVHPPNQSPLSSCRIGAFATQRDRRIILKNPARPSS